MGAVLFMPRTALAVMDEGGGYRAERLKRIDFEALTKKISDKEEKKYDFMLIDTRNESDFQKGFIPGAVNLPFKKHRFMAVLPIPKDKDIVCYGYSATQPSDVNAVIYLLNRGYERVEFYAEGYAGWAGHLFRRRV